MSLSSLAYLRGSAVVMARDLAGTPSTGIRVQLGGDAHLSNFGIFGTPERQEVFDVDDFDETLPGPWEWDVKRLATSLVVAGLHNGSSSSQRRRTALRAARSYRRAMARFATMTYLDIWYSHIDPSEMPRSVEGSARHVIGRYARKALGRTGLRAYSRLVVAAGGRYRIRDQPPLIVHYPKQEEAEVHHALYERYLETLPEDRRILLGRYAPVDIAQKVVGVGSVGTACSVMLLAGDADTEDPLLLQIKQALPSALEPYAGASLYENHAQRVVVGQHLIQEASDVLLGFGSLRGQDFYVRQLRDMKYAVDPAALGPRALLAHGELCAAALARAHARTGDPARIAGYLGNRDAFDRAIAAFAESYAAQTETDHKELVRAIRTGRIPAEVDL
jgi:uncharacterized protein (DUF2252 family)